MPIPEIRSWCIPKKDGSPYNESVVVETPNLTIKGAGSSKFHKLKFSEVLGLDWKKETPSVSSGEGG